MATGKRGFASMDPKKQKSIASKGGRAAHQKGTAHQWTSTEARAAGRKGGITRATQQLVSGEVTAPRILSSVLRPRMMTMFQGQTNPIVDTPNLRQPLIDQLQELSVSRIDPLTNRGQRRT